MAERYKQIIKEDKKLYSPGIPVIVLAYAILHDLKENKYLAQIKYENCSERTISGLVISLMAYNQLGELIEKVDDYHYIEQNASSGMSFGSKSAIRLMTNTVPKRIDIIIKDIIFSDDEAYVLSDYSPLVAIPERISLESEFKTDLIEEYRALLNSKMSYIPTTNGNVWFCSCGTYNVGSNKCVKCGAQKVDVFSYLNRSTLENSKLDKKYERAMLLKNEQSIESLISAKEIFKNLHDYRDAEEKSLECQKIIDEKAEAINKENEIVEKKKKSRTKTIMVLIVAALLCFLIIQKVIIPNNKYNDAMGLIEKKDYVAAYEKLEELKDYKDSEEKRKSILVEYEIEMIRRADEYDVVEFGKYEQDDVKDNGKEKLRWIVLSKDDESALLLSEYGIENKLYNETDNGYTWENCTIRTWLNDTFYEKAFSKKEKAKLFVATVDGYDLGDRVFILAPRELDEYYSEGAFCKPTKHAINAGCFYAENTGNCMWWARARWGSGKHDGSYYDMDGGSHSYSKLDEGIGVAVRPAIFVGLE